MRLEKINDKILTFRFKDHKFSEIDKTLYDCIMVLDSELDEKFKHDDQFSETEDELFYENRNIIDTKLED